MNLEKAVRRLIKVQRKPKKAKNVEFNVPVLVQQLVERDCKPLTMREQMLLCDVVHSICSVALIPQTLLLKIPKLIVYHILHIVKHVEDPSRIHDMFHRATISKIDFEFDLVELPPDERKLWIDSRKEIMTCISRREYADHGTTRKLPTALPFASGCSAEENNAWFRRVQESTMCSGLGGIKIRSTRIPKLSDVAPSNYFDYNWASDCVSGVYS